MTDDALFARLERFYDALPREGARAEDFGPFVLFVRDGDGFPYYARPAPGFNGTATVHDVAAVRSRQRELGIPQAFEWLHETTPGLLPVAQAAGLAVLRAPLLVLDPAALPDPMALSKVPVRLLDPAAPSFAVDLAARRALAAVGFNWPGTSAGEPGRAERDAALVPLSARDLAGEVRDHTTGRLASGLAESTVDGVLASGVLQRVDGVAEVAGVATLPCARRKGLGAAVTAALARHALTHGVDLVFLSAGSAEIARVYQRVGFRRVGTACIATPATTLAAPATPATTPATSA